MNVGDIAREIVAHRAHTKCALCGEREDHVYVVNDIVIARPLRQAISSVCASCVSSYGVELGAALREMLALAPGRFTVRPLKGPIVAETNVYHRRLSEACALCGAAACEIDQTDLRDGTAYHSTCGKCLDLDDLTDRVVQAIIDNPEAWARA
jgi:hypothetical protein